MTPSNAPTPVPTTILETLLDTYGHPPEYIQRPYQETAFNKALTEIEKYYTTRLKKCIGEMETNAKPTSHAWSQNQLKAEILKKWNEET